MHNILEVAKQAARIGGEVIQEGAGRRDSLDIEQKSLHDYVSEVDRNSEHAIKSHILSAFPTHKIVGEEYGEHAGLENIKWVIDPLDGTTNFLRGIPHYAVSIAVLRDGVPEYAVVFDPVKDEMFCASHGGGALLNDVPIGVSDLASSRGGLFATGVPFSGDNLTNIDRFTSTMVAILEQHTSGIRRLGSAALDLAYVAAGRYDGYWEANLKLWDIAAGVLLVTEAGGVVSDLRGNQDHLISGDVLAAGAGVHPDMARLTSRFYKG